MARRLKLAVSALEGTPMLEADGDVDFMTLDDLIEGMQSVLGQGAPLTVVDFRKVRSMDASAMGVLFDAWRAIGPDRKLCAIAQGSPEQLLKNARFDSMIIVVRDQESAVELIKSGF